MTRPPFDDCKERARQAWSLSTEVPELATDKHVDTGEVAPHVFGVVVTIPPLLTLAFRVSNVDVVSVRLPFRFADRWPLLRKVRTCSINLDRNDFCDDRG